VEKESTLEIKGAPVEIETAKFQYKLLLDLWARENSVKTSQIAALGVITSILLAAFSYFPSSEILGKIIPVIGIFVAILWFFSIGNTVSHQKEWAKQIYEIENNYPDVAKIFSQQKAEKKAFYGRAKASWVILGLPILAMFFWILLGVLKAW